MGHAHASAIVGRINAAFAAGQAVALAINDDIVDNQYGRAIPRVNAGAHLVMLAIDILAPGAGDQMGANYIGEALTWGARRRIVFRRDQLSMAILGYVAVDLAGFDGGGGEGNAGAV